MGYSIVVRLIVNYTNSLWVICVYIFSTNITFRRWKQTTLCCCCFIKGFVHCKVKSVVSEDALLGTGFYTAAASNATYVLSTRGFCRGDDS